MEQYIKQGPWLLKIEKNRAEVDYKDIGGLFHLWASGGNTISLNSLKCQEHLAEVSDLLGLSIEKLSSTSGRFYSIQCSVRYFLGFLNRASLSRLLLVENEILRNETKKYLETEEYYSRRRLEFAHLSDVHRIWCNPPFQNSDWIYFDTKAHKIKRGGRCSFCLKKTTLHDSHGYHGGWSNKLQILHDECFQILKSREYIKSEKHTFEPRRELTFTPGELMFIDGQKVSVLPEIWRLPRWHKHYEIPFSQIIESCVLPSMMCLPIDFWMDIVSGFYAVWLKGVTSVIIEGSYKVSKRHKWLSLLLSWDKRELEKGLSSAETYESYIAKWKLENYADEIVIPVKSGDSKHFRNLQRVILRR